MFKYHNMIKKFKTLLSSLMSVGDILLFLFPIIWTWFVDLKELESDIHNHTFTPKFFVAVIFAILYILYLVIRVAANYKISQDERNIYRKQILEQLGSVERAKYKGLCDEIHYTTRQGYDILLYDAHGVIRNILGHLRQLVSIITDVSLKNISVNFVYKYLGDEEHWQTIDGSASCSIGTLDRIVENGPSMYHYLYANNCEYVFDNDKSSADWHKYQPSLRDGDDRNTWGSIYCKRIICTLHQDRFVDGILAVSTYNEKFSQSKRKGAISQIEELINEAVSAFENAIKIEMASLYIRHKSIKDNQAAAIQHLIELKCIEDIYGNPNTMSEQKRIDLLEKGFSKFKVHAGVSWINVFADDATLNQKIAVILQYDRVTRATTGT